MGRVPLAPRRERAKCLGMHLIEIGFLKPIPTQTHTHIPYSLIIFKKIPNPKPNIHKPYFLLHQLLFFFNSAWVHFFPASSPPLRLHLPCVASSLVSPFLVASASLHLLILCVVSSCCVCSSASAP